MRNDFVGTIIALAVAAMTLVPAHASAQAPSADASSSAKASTADRQPDIQGAWRLAPGSPIYSYDIEAPAPKEAYPGRDLGSTFKPMIVDPPDGRIPYQPWAREKRDRLYQAAFHPQNTMEVDPQARCVPGGSPRMSYQLPFQIMQMPGYVVFLYEHVHQYRIIPLDGRPHLTDKVKLFGGDSRGHWEGNTLVVDVTNNNGLNWLDVAGDFHTDAFHVVERWTRVSADTLRYEATIEDPNVYTRPWKIALTERFLTDGQKPYQLMEEACYEGNRALAKRLSSDKK
jgi:hypothetical protein